MYYTIITFECLQKDVVALPFYYKNDEKVKEKNLDVERK